MGFLAFKVIMPSIRKRNDDKTAALINLFLTKLSKEVKAHVNYIHRRSVNISKLNRS